MDNKVEEYISKQISSQKEIIKKLQIIIKKTYPKWKEGFFGGSITYGADSKNKFGKAYIVGLKDHVNLGIIVKGLPENILKKLNKIGKITGNIEIKSVDKIDEKEIIQILKAVR